MAKKKKFRFNPETLSYEQIDYSWGFKIKRFFIHLFSGFAFGGLFFFLFVSLTDSPKERRMKTQISQMQAQYEVLDRQLDEMQLVLTDLQERDDNLYRVIFQADPIPLSVRKSKSANAEYYQRLLNKTNSQVVSHTSQKLDEAKKQLYIQSKSYDAIVDLAKNNEARLEHIPAIQPVLNKDLNRVASGYGWRIDPIYHTRRFHAGMDFTAPEGTEVFATGNGRIIRANWQSGYGNCIDVDHGYGYMTRYAHLSKMHVREGQNVKRGDIIGEVGSTGKSTGPHLHYEVHLRGQVMNPQNYYHLDLSPEEYDRMVQLSNNAGQTMD